MSLYFESHVTLDPVFDERLELLKKVCSIYKFRVAELLMKKRAESTPERSDLDTFCTGHDSDFEELKERMLVLIIMLRMNGFVVRRYKIEDVILDSRIDDSAFRLAQDVGTRPKVVSTVKDVETFPGPSRGSS